MIRKKISYKNNKISYLTNESKSSKMIIFLHGLDGSAKFAKPLFNKLYRYKIVAIEMRGHTGSSLTSSSSIDKHLEDCYELINYFKKQNYKIWLLGESIGSSLAIILFSKYPDMIENVFAQSLPNKFKDVMNISKLSKFKLHFMLFLTLIFNFNFKYKANVNYELLSNNKVLHRIATMADVKKNRYTRETIFAWKVIMKSWKIMKNKTIAKKVFLFFGQDDVLINFQKIFKKSLKNLFIYKNTKHILLYENVFEKSVIPIIKKTITSSK